MPNIPDQIPLLPDEEARYRRTLERAPTAAWMVDSAGACTYANERWLRLTGTPWQGPLGSVWERIVHADDIERVRQAFDEARAARSVVFLEYRLNTGSGEIRWVIDTVFPRIGADGTLLGHVGTVADNHARHEAEEALFFSKERFKAAIAAVEGTMWTADSQGSIVEPQPQWEALTGQSFEQYRGHGWADVIHPDDKDRFFEKANASFERYIPFENAEHRLRRADGTWRLYSVKATQVFNCDGTVRELVGIHTDITDRREQERRVQHMANHDALTGLPNRTLFNDRLAHLLKQRGSRRHAVLFMDLNRFKCINDGLGHDVGDRLLIEVAGRLAASLRAGDTVARFGGDEFVFLFEDVQSEADVLGLAQKTLAIVAQPVVVGGNELLVTGSVGAAMYPNDGACPAALLKQADGAMYRAKARGENTVLFAGEAGGT